MNRRTPNPATIFERALANNVTVINRALAVGLDPQRALQLAVPDRPDPLDYLSGPAEAMRPVVATNIARIVHPLLDIYFDGSEVNDAGQRGGWVQGAQFAGLGLVNKYIIGGDLALRTVDIVVGDSVQMPQAPHYQIMELTIGPINSK